MRRPDKLAPAGDGVHPPSRSSVSSPRLLLIHPPLREAEWRRLSGEWRAAPFDVVEHAACRCSEANRRAVSPDECRSEGTPSLGEGPDAGARPLLPLGRLPKGVGRQGETASGRYRRNGYVPGQQETSRLSGRLREQARSHRDRFCTRHSRFLTGRTQNPYKIPSLLPVNLPNRRI